MTSRKETYIGVCGVVVMWAGLSLGAPAVDAGERASGVPLESVYRHIAGSFVIVQYHLKKSERPPVDSGSRYGGGQGSVLEKILNKNTHDAIGVILSDKGEVFTSEARPQLDENVAGITVKGPDGVVVPARADRILANAPGRVVRITGEMPKTWRALEFAGLDTVTAETKLYAAIMKAGEKNRIHVVPCERSLDWDREGQPNLRLYVPGLYHLAVLCNAQGRPVGATVEKEVDTGPAGFLWRGDDLRADAGVSADQQKQLEDRLEKDFAGNIYEISIMFRTGVREEEPSDFGGRYSFGPGFPGARSGQERLIYGLGFAPEKLLVPLMLSRAQIAGMDTISVKVDGREVPARFGGVLKRCNAMVMELQEGRLPRTVAFATDSSLARTRPFWGVYVREFAGKDVRVQYTRWIDKRQGYADKWYPVLTHSIRIGSWLLDGQGALVGLCTKARHEQDRLRRYLLGERYERYGFSGYYAEVTGGTMTYGPYGYGGDQKIFEAAELTRILADLPAGYDERVRHLSKDEQKRRVWLGVEYTAPNKEMVKQMDLRGPTQDGRIGLMVNRVYPGSPAAKLGLVEGDILLTLAVPEAPWPIELRSEERRGYNLPDFEDMDIPKEFEAMGMRMPRRCPWMSRGNTLTHMLADIGSGTRVTLRYIHDGETLEKEFVIEQSPRDMLSAAKYKNEKLGLTVKDVTYEVRAGLQLGENEAAVVIADVEEGTPAALARVNRYELIRAVDGEPVEDVETFEKLIAAAREAEKESVRLTVECMGKTRLADLKFDAKATPSLLKSLLPGVR